MALSHSKVMAILETDPRKLKKGSILPVKDGTVVANALSLLLLKEGKDKPLQVPRSSALPIF